MRTTQDLFGGADVNLDTFTPKSAKEFEQFGRLVAQKHLLQHANNAHYKTLLKALLRDALATLEAQQVKDIETSVAGVRSDRVKEEKAKQATSKGESAPDSLSCTVDGCFSSCLIAVKASHSCLMLAARVAEVIQVACRCCIPVCLQNAGADQHSWCAVAGKKKNLNAGRSGGTAGLDDYQYDQALDDEDDFM